MLQSEVLSINDNPQTMHAAMIINGVVAFRDHLAKFVISQKNLKFKNNNSTK